MKYDTFPVWLSAMKDFMAEYNIDDVSIIENLWSSLKKL